MKTLISTTTLEEAMVVAESTVDIIDIRDIGEGAFGAPIPDVVRQIVDAVRPFGKQCSGTLGDLPYKPGTAALSALGMAHCGVDCIAGGLFGAEDRDEATTLSDAIVQVVKTFDPQIDVVIAGYADWRRFDGLSPGDLIHAAFRARADVVMLDTFIKDGRTLFDNMELEELRSFVYQAKAKGMPVVLSGAIDKTHLPMLWDLAPDMIGLRAAVCERGDRTAGITPSRVESFENAMARATICA